MYRRSKFNELLLEIREAMSAEADFDVAKFVEPILTKDASVETNSTEDSPKLAATAD